MAQAIAHHCERNDTLSIEGMLGDLMTFSKKNKLDHTAERLKEMKDRLKQDGYTSFWR